MILVEIRNKLTNRDVGTFIVCDDHLVELKEAHKPDIFHIREITDGFKGECQMCVGGEITPIDIDEAPESFEIQVGFADGSWEQGWTASGTGRHLTYITNGSEIYNTQESLQRRGITEIYIEAGYRLHLDEE